ncbi:hypothetical protein [Bifidobacterium adolescentis]|uniref:hypothetical protein n=1 Tax=Bifidobacterium adolescentis TaxID=1680 RepID=UPI003BA0A6BF
MLKRMTAYWWDNEKLLNEGWKILRVDIMPPTELSNNAVTATNVYILEREANDD